jgi:ABC-2 type transport system permease protein
LLSAELLKLRSVRSPWLLLAASQLLTLVGVGGLIASGADVDLVETWSMAVGHAGLASLLSLVLGIQAVAGEHRHKTITDTYLITPRRDRVILAKLGVYTAVGFAFGVAAALTALIATAGLVAASPGTRHSPRSASASGPWSATWPERSPPLWPGWHSSRDSSGSSSART